MGLVEMVVENGRTVVDVDGSAIVAVVVGGMMIAEVVAGGIVVVIVAGSRMVVIVVDTGTGSPSDVEELGCTILSNFHIISP